MESDAAPYIAALRHSHDRLRDVVQPLAPEKLRSGSYCRDWSIAQVMSHLGSGAEISLLFLDAALEGREAPGREAFEPVWNAWNGRSPEEQARDGMATDERHVQRLEDLSPDQLAGVHLSLFGREFDAAGLTRLRLGEHSVHTWDIAVALDPSARVAPDAVALLIDGLEMVAGRSGKPQGRAMRLHVRTRNPERDLSLEVGDNVTLSPWTDGKADGELELPAEDFLRLVYGRLDPQHTSEGVTARGVDLDELRRIFPGF